MPQSGSTFLTYKVQHQGTGHNRRSARRYGGDMKKPLRSNSATTAPTSGARSRHLRGTKRAGSSLLHSPDHCRDRTGRSLPQHTGLGAPGAVMVTTQPTKGSPPNISLHPPCSLPLDCEAMSSSSAKGSMSSSSSGNAIRAEVARARPTSRIGGAPLHGGISSHSEGLLDALISWDPGSVTKPALTASSVSVSDSWAAFSGTTATAALTSSRSITGQSEAGDGNL
mmetsp:Transcript_60841/g.163252  ORF Transcript_60841/g.163252 Transcript_60841/m.163252 type:complete len:225 (-) Transcript_60841:161-835(-)